MIKPLTHSDLLLVLLLHLVVVIYVTDRKFGHLIHLLPEIMIDVLAGTRAIIVLYSHVIIGAAISRCISFHY